MHVVFQFPIIDFRPLLAGKGGRLKNPAWSSLGSNSKAFIRRFGGIEERKAGGNSDFTGESYFCNAHMSMQYADLHKQGFAVTPEVKAAIHNSYRRFYADGYFVGKMEAGFVDNVEKKINKAGLAENSIDLSDILSHYANLPVTINGGNSKLYKACPLLAERYFKESTSKDYVPKNEQQFVAAGEITIMLVFSTTSGLQIPEHAFKLDDFPLPDNFGMVRLYGYKLKHEGNNLKVWLVETPVLTGKVPKNVVNELRNLRIYLLRIHLEKETMRLLLNAINNDTIVLAENSAEAKLANTWFKKAAEKLFRKERFRLNQEKILDFALHSEETVAPGSFSNLENELYYFQDKYTRENIEKILTGMAKRKVLFICTSPRDKNPFDFGKDYQQIKDALRSSADRTNFEVEIEASVKKNNLLDLLTYYRPDYLHLSMHASLTEGLYFENANGDKAPMSVKEFARILQLFSRKHQITAVVLSACNSLPHAEAIRDYCKHAIGTQKVFPADAGVLYAAKFYWTLFNDNHTDIPYCHEAGQLAIELADTPFDPIDDMPVHEIPVLI